MRGVLVVAWIALAIGCGTHGNSVAFSTESADAGFIAPDGAADDIAITPTTIDIVGTAGIQATAPFTVTGTGGVTTMVSMQWLNDPTVVFSTLTPPCASGAACAFAPAIALPLTNGVVACTPNATMRSAMLMVTGTTGVTKTALVTCKQTASNPSFSIPGVVGPLAAPVGMMAGGVLRVTNNGAQPLSISVQLDSQNPNSTQWQVGMCEAPAICALPVGMIIDVPVSLHPTRHGTLDTTITVSGPPAIGTQTATLSGTGTGGFLRVDQPQAPFDHNFGTIAKGQTATFTVEMTNIGNDDLVVTPGAVTAPFGLSTTPLPIGKNNGTSSFDITCSSNAPVAEMMATVNLATTGAYDRNTDHVTVHCAVANTTVQVTNPLDFGELRVGAGLKRIDVSIMNPPLGGNVTIQRIELVGAPATLTVAPPSSTLPAIVADGTQLTTQLLLTTDTDVVLTDVVLEVDVLEGSLVTLRLPVTGKVGTPAAVVLPASLELGSVCIGTPVAGEATMTNTGTAKLSMQRPSMNSTSFVPLFTKPTDYPIGGATLLPMDNAMVGVMPATQVAGKLMGVLRWPVDIPSGGFDVMVTLELVADGTALSPARLFYTAIDIAAPASMQQTITLENCGPSSASIQYDHVEATSGTANAWLLDPPDQERTLLPGEQTRIRVSFDPREPGHHAATVPIVVDGAERVVELDGDAIGTLPDKTSFYACDCSGSGAPSRGWPIPVALALAFRRRRARSVGP